MFYQIPWYYLRSCRHVSFALRHTTLILNYKDHFYITIEYKRSLDFGHRGNVQAQLTLLM